MDVKQKILELIRTKGPVIPSNISKEIDSDILMTSAHLSELSSDGKIKISNTKIGGTPLYYLPGQESSLENFSDNLHEKEKKAFELLKKEKVLRDRVLEPVVRVALRGIKDFAVPLQVTYHDNKEIFWKWYLIGKEEAESLTRKMLMEKEIKKEEKSIEAEIKKAEIQKEKPQETIKKEPMEKEIKKIDEEKTKDIKKFVDKTDSFLDEIKSYFNNNKIIIRNSEIKRKNSEIDFVLEVPSGIGTLEYYCKAKNKKRVNEGDLSNAYVQGQQKKLPVLFITKGDLTKRAKEMLNNEFKNISVNKI